jgi:alpha-D-ribose 1-methylphosphonate 5-triphosphate diphosphatase
MRAIDAVRAGWVRIICSDYYSAGLLPAAFSLQGEGLSLPQAIRMVTLHPAQALGIAQEYGSVEVGKRADLILVDTDGSYPIVRKTMMDGEITYQANYQKAANR